MIHCSTVEVPSHGLGYQVLEILVQRGFLKEVVTLRPMTKVDALNLYDLRRTFYGWRRLRRFRVHLLDRHQQLSD